jgi:Zn-dependent protease
MTLFVLEYPDEAAILIGFFLLVAFPVHELCHAVAAWRLGDNTARWGGYLTLNPIKHFHPMGGTFLVLSVLISGIPLGFAATPVNRANLRGRYGDGIVAAAGPLSNVALALVFGLATRVLADNLEFAIAAPPRLWTLLTLIVYGNIVLAIFNFLPVPPLDGSTVLMSLLTPELRRRIEPTFSQYGMLLLLVVFVLGGYVISPVASAIFHALVGY